MTQRGMRSRQDPRRLTCSCEPYAIAAYGTRTFSRFIDVKSRVCHLLCDPDSSSNAHVDEESMLCIEDELASCEG